MKLTVMDGRGDQQFRWDPANPEEVAEMRQTVADLKAAGYVFWLVDGVTPADEVSAGNGQLIARKRLNTEAEVVDALNTAPIKTEQGGAAELPERRGPGRPRKGASVPVPAAAATAPEVVAHRQTRGG